MFYLKFLKVCLSKILLESPILNRQLSDHSVFNHHIWVMFFIHILLSLLIVFGRREHWHLRLCAPTSNTPDFIIFGWIINTSEYLCALVLILICIKYSFPELHVSSFHIFPLALLFLNSFWNNIKDLFTYKLDSDTYLWISRKLSQL